MQVEHLAAPADLMLDRVHDHGLLVGLHDRLDRVAVGGGGLDHREVARTGQRHVKGPGNRRGAHRQDVDRLAHPLEPLLVLHPEALLLVHDHEPEVLEHDVLLEQAVGADQDVDLPRRQGRQDLALFLARAKPAHRLDCHRVPGHALPEAVEVLLGEDGGGDKHRHLTAALDRLECRPDRHLRLPETDVAADQPVHGAGLLHVGFRLLDGPELVAGLREGEGRLEFLLPGRVRREGVAGLGLPRRLDLEKLGREVDRRPLGGLPGLLPAARPQPSQLRADFPEADVAADQVGLLERDMKGDRVVELERDDLLRALRGVEDRQAAEDRDPVLEMDDEVALHQVREVEQLVDLRARGHGAGPEGDSAGPLSAEDLGFGDEDEAPLLATEREGESRASRRGAETLVGRAPEEGDRPPLEPAVLLEDFPDAALLAGLRGDDCKGVAALRPLGHLVKEAAARILLGLQSLLGDEGLGGVGAVMAQAFRVPHKLLRVAIHQGICLVDVAHRVGGPGPPDQCVEPVVVIARQRLEFLLEARGLHEHDAGSVRQVVGYAGLRRLEGDARGGRDADRVDRARRALRDRIEGADLLDLVPEEVEAVRLRGRDGIHVDDAAADRVVPG